MRIFIILILTLTFNNISAQTFCKKCDIEKVKTINENLDNLTFEMIEMFLCTFDKSCKQNIEFSEWSNEMLFKVLNQSTDLYFKVLVKGEIENSEILKAEIENPINEFNYQEIFDKIKNVKTERNLKNEYLKILKLTAEKEGLSITD